jgi:hypothetical protein
MQPRELKEADFQAYPPLAKKFACDHLALLRDLPVVLAAIMLRELIGFDTRFPQERATIENQFAFLGALTADDRHHFTEGFAKLSLPGQLIAQNWVQFPQKFSEDLSAHLWASGQIDQFHTLGTQFAEEIRKATPVAKPAIPRWTVVVLGPELRNDGYPLFRKLRPHGVFFSQVETGGGMAEILGKLAARAAGTPVPYGHWYIDGASPLPIESGAVSSFSWSESSLVRDALLQEVQSVIGSGAAGPEMLRSIMATWAPDKQHAGSRDPLVDRLVVNVYGEGSGTQIFSTTFVQWSAREVLRRAEPVSLVARFGPRQRQRGMNEMFAGPANAVEVDSAGSLVDADFGAYYTWINLNRLEGAETASFIAWSETYRQAVAIGPGFARGTEAPNSIALGRLLRLVADA